MRLKNAPLILAGLIFLGACPSGSAVAQNFQPTRKLTTWYTDRTPVDLEIIGSTSRSPDSHRLEPNRILRFRLERAYVYSLLAREKPGFEIVRLSLDMQTGLPDALITAVSQTGRLHEDIAGVPRVPFAEKARRTMLIGMQSDASSESLRKAGGELRKCVGETLEHNLQSYNLSACRRPAFPDATYLIGSDENLGLLQIRCRGENFRGIGCRLRFPYEGFAAELSFHRDHLPRWKQMIERAKEFLDSKRYL